jgi:muconate cycloisomerase
MRGKRNSWKAMKVVSAEIRRLRVPFQMEFKHALAARRMTESVILKLTLDSGVIGYGECVPRKYVTNETTESVIRSLSSYLSPVLRDHKFSSLSEVKSFLVGCSLQGAARCAFELALIDAATRRTGESAHALIGPARRSRVHYTAVVPAVSLEWLKRIAILVRVLGFPAAKIKVGTSDDDVERVGLFRRLVGKDVDVRIDANGAWAPEVALERIHALKPFGISSVEEPTRPRDLEALTYVAHRSPVPICVDESLTNLSDAEQLLDRRAGHIFNLRLSKCGGFFNSMRLAKLAQKNQLRYQIGCQVGETGILSGAGRCLLMRLDDALHAEGSYARLLLKRDITRPVVRFGLGGAARALQGPGLGVNVDADALSALSVEQVAIAF